MAADISVVVVTWESADHLKTLVDSMNRHLGTGTELVVVDNDSGDAPEKAARHWGGPVRFEANDRNLGFGAAANQGVALASGSAIVLLNPDAALLDDRLPELAGFALSARALVGPRLLDADGSLQPSASGDPLGPWAWLGVLVPGGVQPSALLRRTEPWRLEIATRVGWLSGACIAAPRDLLLDLGPFDPRLHMYAEDMELCLRAGQEGVASWFRPDLCEISHERRGSSSKRWRHGPEDEAARGRREVIARLYGDRAERRAWWTQQARLAVRLGAKRVLRRPASVEARELEALRAAPAPDSPRERLRRSG